MAKKKISITQKRWLLSLHILCTVAWLGAGLCSLVLNIVTTATIDIHALNTIYVAIEALDRALLRAGAVATIVTGILLSVLTQWGLFRFYWIIAKEILSILCIPVGFLISDRVASAISMTATKGFYPSHSPLYSMNHTTIFCGMVFEIVAFSAVIAISVFKPWGQRKQGKKHISAPTRKTAGQIAIRSAE